MKKWIPIFPLKMVLFPGEVIPLHIFENRYREMISYCRKNDEPFGIAAKIQKIHRTVCLAEIVEIGKEYPDGKLDILCRGKSRCFVHEFDESKPYMMGLVEEFDDFPESLKEPLVELKREVLELYEEMIQIARKELDIPESQPNKPIVSFDFAHQVGFSLEQKQSLLAERSERDRLQIIRDHLQEIMPRIKAYESMKEKVKSNGHFRSFPDT